VQAAYADVILNLAPSTLNVRPGGTIEFIGTLTNTGTTDVYLNGDLSSLPYMELSLDDTPFFADSPLFLSAGGSYNGPFFDITADASAIPGSYTGSYTVQGGADSNAFVNLASQDFTVDVGSSASVPEPNYSIFSTAVLIIIILMRSLPSMRNYPGRHSCKLWFFVQRVWWHTPYHARPCLSDHLNIFPFQKG